MQISILKKSEIIRENTTFRIDAEYFRHQFIDAVKTIEKCKFSYVGEVTSWVTQGQNPVFSEQGVPCLTGRNINKDRVSYDNADYVSGDEYNKLLRYQLEKGDTLITLKGKGSIGKVGYITSDKRSIFSRNIGVIRPSKINSGYLNVFILCKHGRLLVDRGETGETGQSTLTINYLKSIPVPRLSIENTIGETLTQVENLVKKSIQEYKQAQNLLLTELELSDWQPEQQLTFIKNYSDAKQAGRIDAEYFQPKYDEIEEAIKSYSGGWDALGNLCELVGHPSNPPYADTEEKNKTFIVAQKHLGDYCLSDDYWKAGNAKYTTTDFVKKNKLFLLQKEDLVLYTVGAPPHIGKANLIFETAIPSTIGSFVTLVRANKNKVNPYFLLTLLNSPVGYLLTNRFQRGMVQQYIYPKDLVKTTIPFLSEKKQLEIQKKVVESFRLRKQSKHLLECAKRAVEMAIEQDEQVALRWLKEQTASIWLAVRREMAQCFFL